jgi:excisionase family DNA binding protein
MRKSKETQEDTLPRVLRKSSSRFSVLLSDKAIVRSQVSRDKRSEWHYAADGTLVRIDAKDDKPPRTTPYNPSELFTSVRGAAEQLGVHPATMRRMAVRGDLRALRIGNQWITTAAWVEEFRRKRRPAGRPRKSA